MIGYTSLPRGALPLFAAEVNNVGSNTDIINCCYRWSDTNDDCAIPSPALYAAVSSTWDRIHPALYSNIIIFSAAIRHSAEINNDGSNTDIIY